MSTLNYTIQTFIQHLDSVEVVFRYDDLPRAFAQMIVTLPRDLEGNYMAGEQLADFIKFKAPPREWFEDQDAKLSGAAFQGLPPEVIAAAPVQACQTLPEWYEDIRVGEPQLLDGQWVRPSVIVDLRSEENFDMLKARLVAKLADVRFEHEVGGVTVNGAEVKTDRELQATISGAYVRATTDPATTVAWKAGNGFVTLDADDIIFFGGAVFDHVQGCFARESHFTELINAAETVADLVGIDITEGWSN